MYNYVMLVGRLTKDPTFRELNDGKRVADLTLAVKRGFKNYEGEDVVEFIPVTIWDQLADVTNEYCHKGQMILVKGRICNKKEKDTLESGAVVQNIYIQGEKVIFLSSINQKELVENE